VPLQFKVPRYDPLAVKMRQLASGRWRKTVAGAIRDEVEQLIDEQFDRRAAPDGTAWEPRKPPTGTWPLLEKTGRMRRSYHVVATTTGIRVTNSRDYAGYHQTGTIYMPARKVLPDGPLPADWRARLDAAIIAELDRIG
jgi:phage gpG-like protein